MFANDRVASVRLTYREKRQRVARIAYLNLEQIGETDTNDIGRWVVTQISF
jgi:hypothetical protein